MSVTQEEAAHILEYSRIVSENFTQEAVTATYVMALTALRGPTREQVEKVWRGEWKTLMDGNGHLYKNMLECSRCRTVHIGRPNVGCFCPSFGAPMTDEAVEMVMEGMGAAYGQASD